MNTDKIYLYRKLGVFFLALVTYFYAVSIFTTGQVGQNVATVLFILSLLLVFLVNYKFIVKYNAINILYYSFSLQITIYTVLLIAFYMNDVSYDELWPYDSKYIHVPGAQYIRAILDGQAHFSEIKLSKIYPSHFFVGVCFYLFGDSPVVSSFALLAIKILSTYYLWKLSVLLFGEKVAAITILLYALLPTNLLHTVQFYKEGMIQLLVILSFYLIMFIDKKSKENRSTLKEIYVFAIVMFLLLFERFYIAGFILLSVYIYFVFYRRYYKLGILGVLLVINAFYWLFFNYDMLGYRPVAFEYGLGRWRDVYMSGADVNNINKTLPYMLAIVKLYFSPYFLPSKLSGFQGLGLLWVWGAFVNHLVLIFALKGIYEYLKINIKMATLFIIPILLFLLLYGYLAPFSGRQRDSFIGILIMFSCYGFIMFFSKNKASINMNSENNLKVDSSA